MKKNVKYLASSILVTLSLLTPQASHGMDAPMQEGFKLKYSGSDDFRFKFSSDELKALLKMDSEISAVKEKYIKSMRIPVLELRTIFENTLRSFNVSRIRDRSDKFYGAQGVMMLADMSNFVAKTSNPREKEAMERLEIPFRGGHHSDLIQDYTTIMIFLDMITTAIKNPEGNKLSSDSAALVDQSKKRISRPGELVIEYPPSDNDFKFPGSDNVRYRFSSDELKALRKMDSEISEAKKRNDRYKRIPISELRTIFGNTLSSFDRAKFKDRNGQFYGVQGVVMLDDMHNFIAKTNNEKNIGFRDREGILFEDRTGSELNSDYWQIMGPLGIILDAVKMNERLAK